MGATEGGYLKGPDPNTIRLGRLSAMVAKPILTPFTGDEEADRLLSTNALALLTGMLLDQQVPMEWAFAGPLQLRERLGGLDAAEIATMTPEEVVEAFVTKPALHRYPASMAKRVHELCVFIVEHYDGKAENIWKPKPTAEALLVRLLELPGYGPQKARIFLAILGKRLGVAPAGWECVADVYGQPGYRSIADVDGPGAIEKVRTYKQSMKAQAKAAKASKAARA
ncbi:MAG: HhH-GPD-type base excision DNA repair protein [Acidimicrobiales bacterium]